MRQSIAPTSRRFTAEHIHAMRAASGTSMAECVRAAEFADRLLDGDYVLGLLTVSANGYAVNIRSRNPDVSDKLARMRWNVGHAQGSRERMLEIPEWAVVQAISHSRFDGDPEAIVGL